MTFKLEVGGHCANGAKVIALFCNESEGVVLATWKEEFITWGFNANQQDSTANGNYFMYNSDSWRDALARAYIDMTDRIKQIAKRANND